MSEHLDDDGAEISAMIRTARAVAACPVPGCGAPRNPSHVMCRACWALVPRALQSAVYDAWRRVQRISGRMAGTAGYRMAVDAHRGVKESAIQAVVSRR